VSGFVGDERVDGVALEDETVAADIAIVGVGVRPNAELAETAGIELGPTGAIATDEYGRTNYENVYAAGDNAEAMHVVTGEPDHVPLALTANRAGRAIGQTVTGDPTPVGEIAGHRHREGVRPRGRPERGSSTRNGLARPASIRFRSRFRRRRAPTTTIPTARNLRSHWSPTARAANCSAAPSSAARALKRIDTVATALTAGMTVTELQNADLAYAPPFSPSGIRSTAAKVLAGKIVE